MWGCYPTFYKQVSDTCSFSTIWLNSDTVYPEAASDLTGWGLSLTRLLPVASLQMPAARPGHHLCFWPTMYRLKVPMTLSLGSINLLVQLIKLRETFYLLDHHFIIKGYNSGTARWKRCTGQGMGKGVQSCYAPSRVMPPPCPLVPHLHVFTNLEALWTLTFLGVSGGCIT